MNPVVENLRRQAADHARRAARMWAQAWHQAASADQRFSTVLFALVLNRRAIDECDKAINTLRFVERLEQ
ncbi:MAG: hypothetical protein IT174_17050 [Acidobacteria bacterium]|nr:hypothetical protein [Acidobacteriota bacterium]